MYFSPASRSAPRTPTSPSSPPRISGSHLPRPIGGARDLSRSPSRAAKSPPDGGSYFGTIRSFRALSGTPPNPNRGTMKDYEQLVQDLRKENFDLKLRVHLLEERLKLGSGAAGAAEDAHRRVIDLKVEAENLRRELVDKKDLLREASMAIESLEKEHAEAIAKIESDHEAERVEWKKRLELVDREVVGSVAPAPQPIGIPTAVQVDFNDDELQAKIAELERHLNDMRGRVVTAEDEARFSREELAVKSAEMNALRADVVERDGRISSLQHAMEVKEKEVEEKEKKVQTVQEELKTVKPEIVTKTREIEDKDKIIEEKNSQLEQQQKILVEIQITLDEKQKELEEYERKLRASQDRIKELEDLLNAQLKAAQNANQEAEKRLSEIKRRDRRLRDMEAQMKELQDSLNKAKWEAEQGGCASEGGVKEMAEEEMETLWMRLEEMKRALAEMTKQKQEKDQEVQALKDKLDRLERDRRDAPASAIPPHAFPSNLNSSNSGSAPVLSTNIPQQSIHIQPQFAVESSEVAALRDAVSKLRGELEAKKVEAAIKSEMDEGSVKNYVEMELWNKNAEISQLQKELDRMAKQFEKERTGLMDDIDERDKEIVRLRDKGRKLRSALEDARRDGVTGISDTFTGSMGKENSSSSSTNDHKQLPVAQRPLQDATNAGNNIFHVYQAGSIDASIPASLVPLLAACHEETVEALKSKVEALQTALASQIHQPQPLSMARASDAGSEVDVDVLKTKLKTVEEKARGLEKEKRDLVDRCKRELDDYRNQVVQLTDEIRKLRHRREEEAGGGGANIDWRQKYQNSAKKYKKELASVRKLLADSHNACAMLRTRLEEMADFLDQIFAMEEQGLLDLSHISAGNLSAMRRSLDQTRDLSRSLSQSLVVAVIDEEPGADGEEDDAISFSSQGSSFGLREDGSPATPEADPALECSKMSSKDKSHEIPTATKEELKRIRRDVEEKSHQLTMAGDVIDKLRSEIEKLQEGVNARDIEIERLTAEVVQPRAHDTSKRSSTKSRGQLDVSQEQRASSSVSPSLRRKETAVNTSVATHHSSRPHHHHHHHRPTNVVKPTATQGQGKTLSPSESEAWSEPDRNVSLARIGLDQETLLSGAGGTAEDDAVQHSTSSSSDADSQKLATGGSAAAASLARTLQQNRKLASKIKALETINDSLKSELVACHAALGRGEGDQALFTEMKTLRDNLLQAVATQDQIKKQLQDSVGASDLKDEKEKTRAAQAQADRYRQLCDHSEAQIKTLSQRNEEMEKELTKVRQRLSTSGRTEREQRRDLEEWYKVKAVEMQTKDQKQTELQKKQVELQEALATSEAEKKDLKIKLNDAIMLAEKQAKLVEEMEIRCSRLEDELHKALDELMLARQTRADVERESAAARAEVASIREESEARVANFRAEHEARLVLVKTELEAKIDAKVQAARDVEARLEAEREKVAALEAELTGLEEASNVALLREKAEHVAQVLDLKKEIQSHREKANDLESKYIQLLVENQRLLEAKNMADELEAKRQQYLDKSLQVDEFDGVGSVGMIGNGMYGGGVDSPESLRSLDGLGGLGTATTASSLAAASASNHQLLIPHLSEQVSGISANGYGLNGNRHSPVTFRSMNASGARDLMDTDFAFGTTALSAPFLQSPAAFSSSDQGIETDSKLLSVARGSGICPDCGSRVPLVNIPAASNDQGDSDCSASMGILQLELKLVREENNRLLSELSESRGALRDREAQLDTNAKKKERIEKAICRQLHKTHDVLRKASSNMREKTAAERLEKKHHARCHQDGDC